MASATPSENSKMRHLLKSERFCVIGKGWNILYMYDGKKLRLEVCNI